MSLAERRALLRARAARATRLGHVQAFVGLPPAPDEHAPLWGLDYVEATRLADGRTWRLQVWFTEGPTEFPPNLGLDDFELRATDGHEVTEWELRALHTGRLPLTLELHRPPRARPWTAPTIILVLRGREGMLVDPLVDEWEIELSAPPAPAPAPVPEGSHAWDQRVGDYTAVRAALLDRLALTAPQWQERSEADPWMVLVELLAWGADQIAAYQDAVATEAWLGTARRRVSLRRHARLLGLSAYDGCNARAWVRVAASAPLELPQGALLTSGAAYDLGATDVRVYRSLTPGRFDPSLDALVLYDWQSPPWTLPKGATRLALEGSAPKLEVGAVLLLPGGHLARVVHLERTRDPQGDVPIVVVELHPDDALPDAIPVDERRVSANLLLVDHGAPFVFDEAPEVGQPNEFVLRLRGRRLAIAEPLDPRSAREKGATRVIAQDPHNALADLQVLEHRPGGRVLRWEVRADLLRSGPYDRHLVAELGEDFLLLRFGDGVNGRIAPPRSLMSVRARTAPVTSGPTPPGTRLHLADDPTEVNMVREFPPQLAMPASEVRVRAQSTVGLVEVCRAASDYAARTRDIEGVFDATANVQWTGSWYTAFVVVLPDSGDTLHPRLETAVRGRLESLRMLGVDLDIRAPRYVACEIRLAVRLKAGFARLAVEHELMERMAGYFTRARWPLGTPVPQGGVIAEVRLVTGVADVEVLRFRRSDDESRDVHDWIRVAPHEVARVGTGSMPAISVSWTDG